MIYLKSNLYDVQRLTQKSRYKSTGSARNCVIRVGFIAFLYRKAHNHSNLHAIIYSYKITHSLYRRSTLTRLLHIE